LFVCGLLLAAIIFPAPAHAACFNPAANAGNLIYNGGYRTFQYCNGGAWQKMGGAGDTATGLIHWWKLDETSGTVAADSIGGANITLAGTATFATGGMVNNDLNLPNDSTAKPSVITTPSDMLGKSALTMSMWFKRAAGRPQEGGRGAGPVR
jgi:hypothetical protein